MKTQRFAAAVTAVVLTSAVVAGCTADGGGDTPDSETDFTVAFAAAVENDPTHDALARLTEGLAEKRGWDYVYVNNNVDGPTAVSNAKLLVNKGVDGVIEFQVDSTVMPAISKIFEAAEIPWATYSIPGPGAYMIGSSEKLAGVTVGQALGNIALEEWDCELDLLVLLSYPSLPEANERVLRAADGLKEICPDTPDSKIVEYPVTGDGNAVITQEVARNALVANPDAKRILFAGLTDEAVVAGLTAAKQLDRYDEAYAWGQGGELVVVDNADPHLRGAVVSFLEGWAVHALSVFDAIVAGEPLPVGEEDTTESPDAIGFPVCSLTAEEIKALPTIDERVDAILDSEIGTSMNELYCPDAE